MYVTGEAARLSADVSGDAVDAARGEAPLAAMVPSADRACNGGQRAAAVSLGDCTRTSEVVPESSGEMAAAREGPPGVTHLHDPERYRFLSEHGRGGLGRVARMHDCVLGRDVAIKELISRGHVDEVRFLREALITARLEHPGIVPVHEAGRWPDGTPFYSMKLVSGRPLRALIAERRTVEQRIGLLHHVIAVADAIAYAHGRNIIHRDLKPANVIVGEFGETIVIDWGLAKDLSVPDEVAGSGSGSFRSGRDDDLTEAGSVLGTPAYMAPEQERGEAVDQRADVFAIGAMLWELCTLQRLAATRPQQRYRELRRAGIDRDLAVIITKATAPEPERRYRDAGALAADLKAFKSGARIAARSYSLPAMLAHWTRRHRGLAQAVVAAVACAAIGVVMYVRNIAVERDRADQALASAQQERDRARLSEASLLLEKDPLKSRELLASLALESPQYALLMSRAQERAAVRAIPIEAGVEGLFRSRDGSEVVVVTRDGDLYRVDPQTGAKQLVDRDLKQGIAYRAGEWLYARKAFHDPTVSVSTPSQGRALEAGNLIGLSIFAVLDDAVYGLDNFHNVFRLSRDRAPVLVRRAIRSIAGDGHLLLSCALDGTLEGIRDEVVVFRRTCPQNLSPGMMAVVANNYVTVTEPHVLTVSREGRTVDLTTEISGEYELALSGAGVVALADYARGGRPWFVRNGSDAIEAGPTYAAPLFCVAASGPFAAWGYRDGTVTAMDTSTGASWVLKGDPGAVFTMVIVGSTLITASSNELRVWDLKAPPVRRIGALPCSGLTIRPSPDRAHVAMDCITGGTWLWSRSTDQLTQMHKHSASSYGVEWIGDEVCSSGWDGRVLCSTVDGKATRAFDTSAGKLLPLAASPDHRFLVFASPDGRIWKVDDRLHELYSQDAVPSRFAVSPDGARLASSGLDGSLVVYDLTANRIASRIAAHDGAVLGLGWLGDQLWTSGVDGTLRWWMLREGAVEPREVIHQPARLRLTRVFAAGWVADVREGVLQIHRSGAALPLQFELDKHIDSIVVSSDMKYVAATVPGEIVVIDLERNRLATLNIETGSGNMTFVEGDLLALNAANALKVVHVSELDFLPFDPSRDR